MKYRKITPWPASDLAALEAVYTRDRAEGVATLDDGAPEPAGSVALDAATYASEKARIAALVLSAPPPVDPLAGEGAWVRTFLTSTDWSTLTAADREAGERRALRLYGRLLGSLLTSDP